MSEIYTASQIKAPYPRVDVWLASVSAFSRSRIKDLISSGKVSCDGKIINDCSQTVKPKEVYSIEVPDSAAVEILPQEIPLDIIFEDKHILVINKPAGIVVHPAAGHHDGTIVNAIIYHCPGILSIGGEQRPGIIHRLDQYTSGVMVVAKTDLAMQSLTDSFKNNLVQKTYQALVHGHPEKSGRIETLIGRHPVHRQRMAVVKKNGRISVTNYSVAQYLNNSALLHISIETGRTHQIRVHMKYLGFPIIGDNVYGKHKADSTILPAPQRQMLHAWKLSFPHPVLNKTVNFETPIPDDFKNILIHLE